MRKKILVLMKRFGSNKDMVVENFGREIRLFEQLSKKYEIDFVCADYTLKEEFSTEKRGIRFIVIPASIFNPLGILKKINDILGKKKYDVIVPTTEPVLGIIGYYFAGKYRIPIVYEVQDNYEAYSSYKIPFVKWLDRRVIRNSDFVFYSNYPLMKKHLPIRSSKIEVIENGVDVNLFREINKSSARKKLGLENGIKIIAYVGSISKDRGLDILIDAAGELWKNDSKIRLLLSGKIEDVDIKKPWVIYEKFPKRSDVVLALNASDVLAIASADNDFTRYCFPQKLLEYMAVNVPIVATSVGDVARVLKGYKNSLARPGSKEDIMKKIKVQLSAKKTDYRKTAKMYSWKNLSRKLDRILSDV